MMQTRVIIRSSKTDKHLQHTNKFISKGFECCKHFILGELQTNRYIPESCQQFGEFGKVKIVEYVSM